jgi:AcrR family transcriptional regulator
MAGDAEPTGIVKESSEAPRRRGAGRRRRESERRRQAILDAARRAFGRLGFAGATVEAIAREAGVSNGLLYQFFRNKEHLFEVVVDELLRDWIRAMLPRDDAPSTALEALERMFRRSVAFCRTNPLLPALLTRDQLLQLSRFSDVGARRTDAHREHVAALLARGVATGELRPDLDVEATADVICQLQVDYSTRAYQRDPRFPATPRVVDAAVRFVLDAVRRPEAGGPGA